MKLFLLLLYLIIVSDRNSNKYQQIRQLLFQNMTAYLHKNSLLLHICFTAFWKSHFVLCQRKYSVEMEQIDRRRLVVPYYSRTVPNFSSIDMLCEVGVGGIELHCLSDQAKKTMWFNIGVEGYVYGLNELISLSASVQIPS